MKTGVLGGTFDPPHIGHLRAAIEAREVLGLDRVLLVVANNPWQKAGTREITPVHIRLEMMRVAVEGIAGVEASDVEVVRGGDSYTVDTLRALHAQDPNDELIVLIGVDVVDGLHTWHEAPALPALADLGVFGRPTAAPASPDLDAGGSPTSVGVTSPAAQVAPGVIWPIRWVAVPLLDISSSAIRARVQARRSIDLLVPAGVAVIIEREGIYRDGP